MQTSVPELMDIAKEPSTILELYGASPANVVRQQLPARPPARRARRPLRAALPLGLGPARRICTAMTCVTACRSLPGTDQPIAALINDLKQRGLLDETLIVWGGEFGRTPMNEERNGSKWLGRDHHPHAFTHLDGRRRRQARDSPMARPTNSAITSSKIRCTSTTCKPRSCTAGARIT